MYNAKRKNLNRLVILMLLTTVIALPVLLPGCGNPLIKDIIDKDAESGTDKPSGGDEGGGSGDEGVGDPAPPAYVLADPTNPDIKAKFGVSTASEAFAKLHLLISTPLGTDDFTDIIALGDYIDLPSLTIGGTTISDAAITPSSLPFAGYEGRLLRLIVVGVNSFKRDGAGNVGTANANNPSAPNHVVFQFQNIPVTRQMEASDFNTNGYAGSAMKAYLMGDFLSGLKTATGLTNAMLWAPARRVSQGGYPAELGTDTVTDTLWLPTVWEMFGSNAGMSSTTSETTLNQARLEYYTVGGNASCKKYDSTNFALEYWLASPYSLSNANFCYVRGNGNAAHGNASLADGGCAPAFCVK